MERLDIVKLVDAVLLEPGEERAHRSVIGHAGIVVVDRGGEKIEETACRAIAGLDDHCRDRERNPQRRCRDRRRGVDHRRHVAAITAHADTL